MEPLIFGLLLIALSLPAGLGLLARLSRRRSSLLQAVPVDSSLVTRGRAASRRALGSMGLVLGVGLLAAWLILSVPGVLAQSPGATVGTAKSLAGSALTGSFPSGQEFTFFVSYSCAAIVDDTCESVVITDTLDPALEFLEVSSLPDGASVSHTGDDVVISLNDLDDGDSGIISVRVRFDLGTLPDTTVTNTATIDAANANPATSNLVTVTSLGNFQMTVNKGVVANAQVGVIGSQFRTTYQLNICNPNNGVGGVPLLNPVITDTLPAGALPVLPIPLGGTYISATQQIVWYAGQNGFPLEIPVTADCFTFYVPVYYDESTPGVISGTNVTNNFQVSGNPADDPSTTENLGPAGQTTTLRDPAYDASLTKSAASPSDHPDDPGVEELPGGPVTYTLTYRNEGTLAIDTVVITDIIPPEIETITTVTVDPITAGQTITLSYELDSSGVWIVDTVTTAAAVVDLSGVPGRVTGLRWELGDVPLDMPAWSAQINAILDDTLTTGAAANNCADGTGIAGGLSRLENACVPVDIIYQRAIPRAEKLINDPGPHPPGAVVTYTLRVINDDVAHYNVVAPITLADNVPEELEVVVFDGGSYRPATAVDAWFTYTGVAPAPAATLSPNYGLDNATLPALAVERSLPTAAQPGVGG